MSYDDLQKLWRLRVIQTEEDYHAALAVWEDYFSDPVAAQDLMVTEALEYAEVLAMLMNRWE